MFEKANQFLSMSQLFFCTGFDKVHPLLQVIGTDKPFSDYLRLCMTLKMGIRFKITKIYGSTM